MFLFCLLYINHHVLAKQSIQHLLSLQSWSKYFLCFCNSLSSYIRKDINFLFLPLSPSLILNVLIYQVILGNIKTNSCIPSSKYVIKYLELFFVSTNIEMAIFINIRIPNFIILLHHAILLLLLSFHQVSTLSYYQKNFVFFFWLIDTNIFLRIYYNGSDFDLY